MSDRSSTLASEKDVGLEMWISWIRVLVWFLCGAIVEAQICEVLVRLPLSLFKAVWRNCVYKALQLAPHHF